MRSRAGLETPAPKRRFIQLLDALERKQRNSATMDGSTGVQTLTASKVKAGDA